MSSITDLSPAARIRALERRITSAAAHCEAWRRTRFTEKYMEAFDLVEALRKQVEEAHAAGGTPAVVPVPADALVALRRPASSPAQRSHASP